LGWYWWVRGAGLKAQDSGHRTRGTGLREEERRGEEKNEKREEKKEALQVTRLKFNAGVVLAVVFVVLYGVIWAILSQLTDSPVPEWDSFITSLSIVATWMLARKIYEHWYLWIIVNFVSVALFITRGLYPTVILYVVYGIMSFAGLREWKKTIKVDIKAL
jgi:nicotinamide mononucleotide transporter